jgi:hypothetical protein
MSVNITTEDAAKASDAVNAALQSWFGTDDSPQVEVIQTGMDATTKNILIGSAIVGTIALVLVASKR